MTRGRPRWDLAPLSREGGFSLLEVLIALAILGTAVVVSIQAVSQGLRLLKLAGDQQQAVVVADQKAREVVTPLEREDSGLDGRFAWTRVTRVLATPELTPADAPPKWRVFETTVAVTWDGERRVEVTTLHTVRATSDATRDTTGKGVSTGGTPGSAGAAASSGTSSRMDRTSGASASSGSGSGRSGLGGGGARP